MGTVASWLFSLALLQGMKQRSVRRNVIFMNSLCKACGESWEAGIRRNPEDGDGDMGRWGDGDDAHEEHAEHAEKAFGVHKVWVFAR